MKVGDEVIVDWPKVYAPSRGRIISINKETKTAKLRFLGGITEFSLDKLKKE